MENPSQYVVQRLWNYCSILRDDGMSYSDYIEQLTYLLFLKMAYERTQSPYQEKSRIPEELSWETLLTKSGGELMAHYRHILEKLGTQPGMLGVIFRNAVNKVQNPVNLRRLIADQIDHERWTALDADIEGDAYEGLLEKNAEDTKSGAGQYFTPRALIKAIVEVMQPAPKQVICDPACGTGGFLLAAHDYILQHYAMTCDERQFLKDQTFQGWEIVDGAARLCVMNMFLHGIGDENAAEPLIHVTDSLRSKLNEHFDMVLTNPPFGKRSGFSMTSSNGKKNAGNGRDSDVYSAGNICRDDFWAMTSNKQLNFVQHIYTLLNDGGRAAVVVPDNVLFEGGAGETIRRNLLRFCNVHTLLRLPTGIFYAQGVKANLLFFDKIQAGHDQRDAHLWVYDLRTNMNFTLRTNPLKRAHLDDFVAYYQPGQRDMRQEGERFRAFRYEDLLKRDKASLDLFWLRDKSLETADNLPAPGVIIAEIIEDLQNAIALLQRF
jgi:type I restriction enzyme M protein